MTSPVLRIIDANANRAREALRVVEDYARFVLNNDAICESLKQLRHDLLDALKELLPHAILWRDTPGDVGVEIKTNSELHRKDIAHVVTAAGKRLGEALRTIEEYLKTADPASASRVERLRYQFYDLEHRLAFTLRPANRFQNVRLYVLITQSTTKLPWLQAAEQAILGGADCLQLREKDLDSGELLSRARAFVDLCRKHNVISIINDRADIALLSNADGLHVGQLDLPAREARKLLGPDKILGVSTHNLAQAHQAVSDGADYIGAGPVFKSPTKAREFVAGLDYAREVATHIKIPSVAIAGITEQNLDQLLSTGLRAIAVTSAILASDDIRSAAHRLKSRLNQST